MKLPGRVFLALALTLSMPAFAATDVPTTIRPVQGQTLTSSELPAARLTFARGFHYVGGQRFALYGVADAEQHFFVDADAHGQIRRLYWLQFEHYMSDNDHHYKYPMSRTAEISGRSFLYDTEIYTDYADLKPQAGSDVAQARQLLAAKGLHLPQTAIRARMFHAPENDRSELMIIYVEAMPPGEMPKDAANEMPADDKFPQLAADILRHAQASLKIEDR